MRELALPLFAGVALGVGALCFPSVLRAADRLLSPPKFGGCTKDTAKTDCKTLVQVVDTYKLNHPEASRECPTFEALKADRALKPDQNANDPWGRPYKIVCNGDLYGVMSAGPDGKDRTADDIWAGSVEASP